MGGRRVMRRRNPLVKMLTAISWTGPDVKFDAFVRVPEEKKIVSIGKKVL